MYWKWGTGNHKVSKTIINHSLINLKNTIMKKTLLLSTCMMFFLSYAQLDTSQLYIKMGNSIPFIDSAYLQPNVITQTFEQEDSTYRRLYFIHGLGGDASSWQRASDACWDNSLNIPGFPARRVRVSRPEYTNSTLTTLNSAAYEVNTLIVNQAATDITAYSMNPQRAFIVAHSQGGMVTRSLVHQYMTGLNIPNFGMPFGGFVTFASPLQGAKILNNRDQIELMANDACRNLIKGPGSNLGFGLILKVMGKELTGNLCDIVSYDLLPAFFTDYYDNITNDYTVGANAISLYNQDVSYQAYMNMPKIAFCAIEPRNNILWRTGNWLINNPNTPPPFEANDDWNFYNTSVFPLYLEYVVKAYQHQNQINLLTHMAQFTHPILTPNSYMITMAGLLYHQKRKNDWQQGVDWFQRANFVWETIIGAREFQYTSNTMYVCLKCRGNSFHMDYLITANQQECINRNCQNIVPVTVTELNYIIKESDGVVVAESADNLPGATAIPLKPNTSAPNYTGSSHMQVRNDRFLKQSLFQIFNGDYGLFFKTKTKNEN